MGVALNRARGPGGDERGGDCLCERKSYNLYRVLLVLIGHGVPGSWADRDSDLVPSGGC